MWISLTAAALLAATFAWLTLQLWRYSCAVGSELSIHRRERLSHRLQALVLGSAAVATLTVAVQSAFLLQSLDARTLPASPRPVMLRLDSELRFVPAPLEPAAPAIDDVALAATAR